ncbi:d-aspartate oxidase [Caerostris extrusa]|uniref:D-aspartate oxidase n=1 Tax=Caerostris extrusa TaxID=172846 RepID=A0AAV4XYJ3_CAEEX|nr:d-aspartate oxidase [Caerostris extrusa]
MVLKVAVIGGGVIGITSAYVIAENLEDVQVTVFSESWSPLIPRGMVQLVTGILCQKSFEVFQGICKTEEAVEWGVGLLSVFSLATEPLETPPYQDLFLEYRPLCAKELSMFPSRCRYGAFITTFFVECTKFLPVLMKRLQRKGGKLIEKKIETYMR